MVWDNLEYDWRICNPYASISTSSVILFIMDGNSRPIDDIYSYQSYENYDKYCCLLGYCMQRYIKAWDTFYFFED